MHMRPLLLRLVLGSLPFVAIALFWHWLAARQGQVAVPSISEVCAILSEPFAVPQRLDIPSLWSSAMASLGRTICGFLVAVVLAVPFGIFAGRYKKFRDTFSPVFTFFYVVSPLAWLPVLISVIGMDSFASIIYGRPEAWRHEVADSMMPAMVLIIAMGAFFPVYYTTERASASVREDLLEAAGIMGASRWGILRRVVLPWCLPEIISGMRIGMGRAWMVIVAAEMYPGTISGLGYTIWTTHASMEYGYTFAAVIILAFLGLVMNAFLYYLEKKTGHWEAKRI